jgi:hypothetical protein
VFLGKTNGAGKVQYAFDKAGNYILVAFKPGYWPGLKPLVVGNGSPSVTTTKARKPLNKPSTR